MGMFAIDLKFAMVLLVGTQVQIVSEFESKRTIAEARFTID